MKTNLFSYIIFLLLFSHTTLGATIQGTIYDFSLTKITNTVVEVNTEPLQKFLSKDGTYKFEVNKGNYTLIIKNPKTNSIITEENIIIKDDGVYNLDLFVTEEENFNNILDGSVDITLDTETETNNSLLIISIIFIILGVILIFVYRYLKKNNKEVDNEDKKIHENLIIWDNITKEEKVDLESDLEKIINIIKKEGNRTTQKEIRKHFPLSEAKISLMLSELEHKGKITRIKKGRANIIVLKQ